MLAGAGRIWDIGPVILHVPLVRWAFTPLTLTQEGIILGIAHITKVGRTIAINSAA
jgi:hypothetical protein